MTEKQKSREELIEEIKNKDFSKMPVAFDYRDPRSVYGTPVPKSKMPKKI